MQLRKTLLMTMILPLLTSCNKSDITGLYSFQLGKATGTHFGLYLDLKSKEFIVKDTEEKGFKEMSLSFSVNWTNEAGEEEDIDAIAGIIDMIKDKDGNVSLPGYYKLTDQMNKKGEARVKVGIDMKEIAQRVAIYYENITGETLDVTALEEQLNQIDDSALIQSLMYATYKDNVMNFYIPVSLENVYYQCYWYGYDIQIKRSTDEQSLIPFSVEVVEVTKHDMGSHPTKEEVAEISKDFQETHKDMVIKNFRDYNALCLGLTKK